VLLIVPTSFDVIIAPDVVGKVITLPLDVVIVDTFTVVAVIVPFAVIDPLLIIELLVIDPLLIIELLVIDPLLIIELLVIVPNTVTLENTFDISGTPLA